MMTWKEPTDYAGAQASLIQVEIIEMFNRMRAEGIEPALMVAGAGAAIADLLTTAHGAEMVPLWFQKQANFTRKLVANGRH